MRPARALCRSRLASLISLVLITTTTAHYQGTLICKQPETQVCLSWLVHSDELQNFNNAEPLSSIHTRDYCGFSKMRTSTPYQKFYKVLQLNKNKLPKTLHCKRIILIGLFVDWVEIGYALSGSVRVRRQTFTPKGRYRGQTQSQYLAIDRGNRKDEGKAEAHSAADSSRASVSGNSGMGQAQSQSIYDPNCEDCYRRPQVEVENLKHPGSPRPFGNGYGQNTGSTWPGVNNGQGNYIPNYTGYHPIDTPGQEHSTSSGLQKTGFYGPQSKTNDGYEGTGPNDNINYHAPGSYDRPTSNNGNMVLNNRPMDTGTHEYGPNNIGGYDTKNVPGNNYKSPGNVGGGSYRPGGTGTNGYSPIGNGVYDSVGNVAPDTNGVGNTYTTGYPKQGAGLGPLDNNRDEIYGPTSGNANRFGPGGISKYGTVIGPGQGSEHGLRPGQGLGPGQGSGQGLGPGQGQEIRPGQGQGIGPDQGHGLGPGQGQGLRPGQGQGIDPGQGQGIVPNQGHGIGPGQRPGIGPSQGQGIGPGQGQGVGPGQGQGVGPGQGQVIGPGQGYGIGPGQGQGGGPGQGQGIGPGQGQGVGPGQGQGIGPGQGYGIGPGQGQGVGPGQGQGIGPGQGQGVGPGQGQGVGPGQGQGIGPGQGYGIGPGQGQGLRPGQGQGIGPGQGQGIGPGQGQGVEPGQGQGPQQGIRQNGLPSTGHEYGPNQRGLGNEYDPYQRGLETRYGPNQGNLGSVYRPDQHGLRADQIGRGTNWPLASGPYAGPGGSNYYCCSIPNTGSTGNLYPNNYAIHGQSGSGVNGPNGATNTNTNQYGTNNSPSIPQSLANQYSTDSGRPSPPGEHLGTGLANGPTGDHYGPGRSTSTFTQPSQYGTEFDTPSQPGGQYATGISSGPNSGSQNDRGQGYGMRPSNYGTGIDSTRLLNPGGQSGTGVFNGPTVGSPYIPGNLPNGQIGGGSGPSIPGGQYSTNVGNVLHQQYGTFNPNEHNGGRREGNSGIYNGQPLPGGHYNNGINGGISPGQYGSGNVPKNNSPGSQYNTGIGSTPEGPYSQSNTPLRQYGTGTPTSQNVPDTQVGTGPYRGQHGTGGQFGPIDNSGMTSPGQQYGKGPNTSGTNSAGRPLPTGGDQNGPVGMDTTNYPGSHYGAGLGGPEKSNGLGTTGPSSHTGYTGGPDIPGQPYGSDYVNTPSYGTGNVNYNSNAPSGTYQGSIVGGRNGGVTSGQGDGIPNNYNGAPSDGSSGSHNRPYNPSVTGVQNNEYSGIPQNYIDPNTIDGDDSEAEASVAQGINGTIASASSKGGNDKARAQTNVHGTYTGSGSFQAQAQITGDNKEAQSEVSGGKKGASSTASGSGRNNKSQASVQLGSETGSVQTQSQSAGVMHSSNSQVQGGVKGGMADAQAKGPGSTSSQAQIGFTPYKDTDKSSHDLQETPFAGGGVASAQSSGRTGQSQSQLHGTFKYGITYNGAAQSGASLNKDAVFRNRLSFEKIDVFDENEKNVNIDMTETPQSLSTEIDPHIETSSTSESYDFANENEVTTTENVIDSSTLINSESAHTHLDHHKTDNSYLSGPTLSGTKKSFSTNHLNNPGTDYEYSTVKEKLPPESDYDTDEPFNPEGSEESDLVQGEYSNYDEFTRESPTHQSLLSSSRKPLEVRQSTGGNTQHIVLGSLKNHNAEIIQRNSDRPDENRVYLAGERIPGTGGYTIPAGFTGSVKSVASKDNTYVVGYRDSPSQAQTVTLTPGTGKVKYMYPPAYGKHVMPKNLRSLYSPKDDNKYLSVSKSVTRALDNENNIRKQYSHTYYTKSSSCGYFTFTCTMVSSAEGRKKVCKPKIPTNPDGTQIRC